MNADESSSAYKIMIDRIVLDGISDDELQEDQFRQRLSEELHRLLARPETVGRIRGSRHEQRVNLTADNSHLTNPVQVARHIVQALQSTQQE